MGRGHRAGPRSGRAASSSMRLLWLVVLLPMSNAQSVIDTSSSVLSLASTLATVSTTTTQESVSSTDPLLMSTAYASTPSVNSTTSSTSTSAKPTDSPPELFPGATNTSPQHVHTDGVFNYYFLFLALFGVLTAVFLWWIHKRRKRRKEQMRLSGHDALARDMAGWINTRRWFHGTRRHNQTGAFVRREEGLNEHGEAPPPYQPKSEVTAINAAGEARGSRIGVTIPLRTLPRDTVEQSRPPQYQKTVGHEESPIFRPGTADTQLSRPDTAITQVDSRRDNL